MTPEQFDNLIRHCEEYTGRPWDGTVEHATAAADMAAEIVDILHAHVDWLSGCKERVERSGLPWNTRTCRDQSRRDGDLAAPPEWLAELSETLTPDWLVNR